MSEFVAVALAVARKDLTSEWRSKELIWSLGQFVLLAVVIANFGFDLTGGGAAQVAPGVLWLALVFAGLVAFGRTFAAEREQASMEAMMLTPAPPAAILAGKAFAAAVVLAVCQLVLVPGLALFFGASLSASLVPALLLATVGMAALGCLLAAVAVQTRARELLLPVLALPLWIPLVVVGGQAVQQSMGGGGGDPSSALGLLVDFDILFVVVASLAARYVLDD